MTSKTQSGPAHAGARRGQAIVLEACAVGIAGSAVHALASPGGGTGYGAAVAGVAMISALGLMWIGKDAGRFIAGLVLLELFVLLLLDGLGVLFLDQARAAAALLCAAAVGCLVSLSALTFAESVADFLQSKRRDRVPAAEWKPFLEADAATARASALDEPQSRGSRDVAAQTRHSLSRARAQGRLVLTLLVPLFAAATVLTAAGAALFLIDMFAGMRASEEAYREMIREGGSWANALALSFTVGIAQAAGTAARVFGAFFGIIAIYCLFLVIPFLLLLPVTLPFALRWKTPTRMLLLRPFNRQELASPLLRLLRTGAAATGHIYTLADSVIRVAWYVRIPLVLGQLSLFSYRVPKIRQPAHIYRVVRGLRRTWLRNLNWQLSLAKVFPVACDDAGWQAAVCRLACETDVILIDLSGATTNVVWELEQCIRLGRLERVIFLIENGQETRARTLLAERFAPDAFADRLLVYGSLEGDPGRVLENMIVDRLAAVGGVASFVPPPVPGAFADPLRRRAAGRLALASALVIAAFFAWSWASRPGVPLDSTAVLWPTPRGVSISRIAVSADNEVWAVAGSDGDIQVVNMSPGKPAGRRFSVGDRDLVDMTTGERGVVIVARGVPRGPVTVWDGLSGSIVWTFSDPDGVFELADVVRLSRHAGMVGIRWLGGPLDIWDLKSGERLMRLPVAGFRTFAFGAGGRLAVGADDTVQLWSISTSPELLHEALLAGDGAEDLAVAPDNSALAVAGRRGLWLWDLDQAPAPPQLVAAADHGVAEVELGANARPLVWRASGEIYVDRGGRRPFLLKRPDAVRYYDRVAITDLLLTGDGRFVIGQSTDDTVVFWTLPEGGLRPD